MRRHVVLIVLAALAAFVAPALAHFPFILVAAERARIVMSETLEPDAEVGIEILTGARLMVRDTGGQERPLELKEAGEWMECSLPGSGTRVVHGVLDLGVQERGATPNLLVYYPKAIAGDPFDPTAALGDAAPVEIVPVRRTHGVSLRLLVSGKPVAAAAIKVIDPSGGQTEYTTDSDGLTPDLTASGRYGAWARHWIDDSGEREGKHYAQVRQYATLVFDFGAPEGNPAATTAATRTSLPRPVASFGAVADADWLYIYGGHAATRHQYSTASVSGRLSRLNLRDSGALWEELPGGVPVQGMNLAMHAGRVLRIGGMEPRNGPDEPTDNYSIAEAAAFDPATGLWSTLTPLPRPRSSHDVVVVGDTLMVVGGWSIQGRGSKPAWLDTLDMLDLSSPGAEWQSVPQPFQRRALTAAAIGKDVFVIGGFDATETPRGEVDIFHAAQRAWSRGPEIPGGSANGFAPAACAYQGTLFLSLGTGEMFRLRSDWTAWEQVAMTTPRIVHRLVPCSNEILVLGGAMNATMTDLVEAVPVPGLAAPAAQVQATVVQAAAPSRPRPERHYGSDAVGESMEEIGKIADRLRKMDRASWAESDPEHTAAAEARRLVEIFQGLQGDKTVQSRPAEFLTMLKAAGAQTETLRGLAESSAGNDTLSSQLRLVFASCKDCHRAYRD